MIDPLLPVELHKDHADFNDFPVRAFTNEDLFEVNRNIWDFIKSIPGVIIHDEVQVGSVVINGSGRDVDWVIFVKHDDGIVADQFFQIVKDPTWLKGGSDDLNTDSSWVSYKKEIVPGIVANAIITTERETFERFKRSTFVAKYMAERFGPLDKAARVAIHRFIMDRTDLPMSDHGHVRGVM